MAQWGRNDQAVTANTSTTTETSTGAPMGTWALVNGGSTSNITTIAVSHGTNAHFGNTSAGSRAAVDVGLFNNTTVNAFRSGVAVGVFGVGANTGGAAGMEMSGAGGAIALTYITTAGSGYISAPTVTTTFANGTTNATAITSTISNDGRLASLVIAQAGSNILGEDPTISIATPAANTFNALTSVSNTADTIAFATANSKFLVGDSVLYTVATGNTAVGGLTSGTRYYVSFANTTVVALSATSGGANINITSSVTETGHSLTGEAATGYIVLGGTKNKGVAHAGWVLRTEGTGGRAGRVQYETLVAMGSLGAQTAAYGTAAGVADASDDAIIPDA
jgi:hypothetical protein